MFRMLLLLAVVLGCLELGSAAPLSSAQIQLAAHNYLNTFGYLQPATAEDKDFSAAAAHDAFAEAIRLFQRFANIPQTGIPDASTVKMMSTPRCGVTDNPRANNRTRYVTGTKWPVKSLTWALGATTAQLTRAQVETEIAKAFKLWTDNSALTITQSSGKVDIDIKFAKGDHGDGFPFDGPSGVLAHAMFPRDGDAHIDDAEKWSLTGTGTNLLQVVAHEFGHSLGLDHSSKQSALMAPFYRGYIPNLKLDADDIAGIQALYGAKSSTG